MKDDYPDFPMSRCQLTHWPEIIGPPKPNDNISLVLRTERRANIGDVAATLRRISLRHSLLRSTMERAHPRPVNHFQANYEYPIATSAIDAPFDNEGGIVAASFAQLVRQMLVEPFDMMATPPLRSCLVRFSDGSTALVVVMNHILGDGWSLDLLTSDFNVEYDNVLNRRPFDPRPASYARVTEFEDRLVASPDTPGILDWWNKRLSLAGDAVVTAEPPNGRPRPRNNVTYVTESLADWSPRRHLRITLKLHTTPFLLALAALVFGRGKDRWDCLDVIDLPKERATVFADVVGPLFSIYPVCIEIPRATSIERYIADAAEAVEGARRHGLPWGVLHELLFDRFGVRRLGDATINGSSTASPMAMGEWERVRAPLQLADENMVNWAYHSYPRAGENGVQMGLEFDPAKLAPGDAEELFSRMRWFLRNAATLAEGGPTPARGRP